MADLTMTAEERLQIQDEALRFAQVGLYRYRFDGTVLDMNQAAFDILELGQHFRSPAEVICRHIEELFVYTGPRRRLRGLIQTQGEARNILYPFRTLGGKDKWVVHDSFPVVDPLSGEQVVQAIIKDVTEAQQREEALRQSQERLARIVETIADGIVILDRSGRFTFANAAAERIVGLPRSIITQRTYLDPVWGLTTAEGGPYAPADLPVAQVLRTGQPVYGMEFAIRRADGARVILSANATPLRDAAGSIVGAIASLSDITERRRLETLREEFLGNAAHALKTPVATIKGYARLLQQWAPGGHEPREGAAFEVINRQSDRLNRLVQGLLDFARLQHAGLELQRQRFDLGEVAAEAVARQQATAPRHRLIVRRDGPVLVDADRDRIDEVLANLLDNAINASPYGGEVVTTVDRQGGEGVVSVQDHGVGIPLDKQQHIFERFFHAHAGTPYDRSGMGMGLYLNREIIARHGGRMWFESVPGQGSVFHFSLPLAGEGSNGRAA